MSSLEEKVVDIKPHEVEVPQFEMSNDSVQTNFEMVDQVEVEADAVKTDL